MVSKNVEIGKERKGGERREEDKTRRQEDSDWFIICT